MYRRVETYSIATGRIHLDYCDELSENSYDELEAFIPLNIPEIMVIQSLIMRVTNELLTTYDDENVVQNSCPYENHISEMK